MSENERERPRRDRALGEADYRLRWQASRLEVCAKVGRIITSILDLDQLLRQTVDLIRDCLGFYHAGIFLLDESGEWAVLREATGEAGAQMKAQGYRLAVDETSMVGWTALHRQPCVTLDVGESAVRFNNPLLPHTRSEMTLPLMVGERVLGVLNVQSTEEAAFDEDDVRVIQSVADQVAVAVENARQHAETAESARAHATEQEAARRLREMDQFKQHFLANMSYELRTPLTNVIGFSRLMLKGIDGPLTELQRNDLEIVYQNSQHLMGLINDLLDVSRIEAGLVELAFQEVDLGALIRSVMATASALVRDRGIELQQEIAPGLPVVQADTRRIRQVLLRLLTNAAKFTKQGAITVRARSDDVHVLVSVSDTGPGIPPEDQERIFKRFESGFLEGGRKPRGAGLGLALSKEFVEMHGGEIWVESEVGKGATFTFSLPVSQEASA
jgi:signal transduction histidine kinase